MSKLIKVLLILVLISILIISFSRNTLCRFLIRTAASKATGLKLSIEELNLDVFKSSLYMGGITLFNPQGFKDKTLGKAKEIFIKYDPWGFLSGRLHFPDVRIDISEINIIRNEKGHSNVSAFKRKKTSLSSRTEEPATHTSPAASIQKKGKKRKDSRPRFIIDRLEVSVKKTTFIDYSAGAGEPAVIVFMVEGPSVYKNVSNLGRVVDSVSAKGGFRSLLNTLAGLIPRDAFKNTTEAVSEAIKNKIKDVLNKVK